MARGEPIARNITRYPQLYSRVGFGHEFRPLRAAEVRELLEQRWAPPGVVLPDGGLADDDAAAAIIRITGGNFRLLDRPMTQVARLVEINELKSVNRTFVESARESLVIGTT